VPYFPDLADYDYAPETVPAGVRAIAVGWLEVDHPFPQGPVPDAFLDALFVACRDDRSAAMRGYHYCPFCGNGRVDEVPPPQTVQRGTDMIVLGDAEVRFVSKQSERWLIAPTLVFHYVEAHGYRPPDEFVAAVCERRVAPLD
jgi:hypothetical protein